MSGDKAGTLLINTAWYSTPYCAQHPAAWTSDTWDPSLIDRFLFCNMWLTFELEIKWNKKVTFMKFKIQSSWISLWKFKSVFPKCTQLIGYIFSFVTTSDSYTPVRLGLRLFWLKLWKHCIQYLKFIRMRKLIEKCSGPTWNLIPSLTHYHICNFSPCIGGDLVTQNNIIL